jgi:hypothetical protein
LVVPVWFYGGHECGVMMKSPNQMLIACDDERENFERNRCLELNSKDFKDTLSKLIPNSLQLAVSEQ